MCSRWWNKLCGGASHEADRLILETPVIDDKTRPSNSVKTSRYTLINFFFKCGFEQFRNLSNVYFLVIIVLAFVGTKTNLFDSPYPATGTLMGLVLVVGFTMTLEGYYDIKRHREDFEVNNRVALRLRPGDGHIEEVPWSALMPGDLVKVNDRCQFPADMVFVAGCAVGNKCYVETANIDGETNLKIKHVPKKLISRCMFPDRAASLHARFEYDLPNAFLQFSGTVHLYSDVQYNYPSEDVSLDFSNLLLRGCVLRNTPWVLGIVLYAGHETKAVQSSREAPSKMSRVQILVNKIIYIILIVELILCIFSALLSVVAYGNPADLYYLQDNDGNPYILPTFIANICTFIVLYSSLLPISLLFCMTFANFFQALYLNWDLDMYHAPTDTPAKCNAIELVQELGQVSYLFSDKTGTLTRNEMKLVGATSGYSRFGLGSDCVDPDVTTDSSIATIFEGMVSYLRDPEMSEKFKEPVRDFLLVNAVCHTVIVDNSTDVIKYNAEGPDEEALVSAMAQIGYELISTDNDIHEIKVPSDLVDPSFRDTSGHEVTILDYEILAINQFNSTRKRMSAVVKDPHGALWLMGKGADSQMFSLMSREHNDAEVVRNMNDDLNRYANEGHRTLVMGKRPLSQEEYTAWKKKYDIASNSLGDEKQRLLDEAAEEIEHDYEIVGASAIEDRLQEGVPETLVALREAGVKTWLLTGDKVETAINIGFSCKLLNSEMEMVKIVDEDPKGNLETLTRLNQLLVPQNLSEFSEKRRQGREIVESQRNVLRPKRSFLGISSSKHAPKTENTNHVDVDLHSSPRNSRMSTWFRKAVCMKRGSSQDPTLEGIELSTVSARHSVANVATFEGDETSMEGMVAENLALVVTGSALQGLLAAERGNAQRERLLLNIAKLCSVVIACRVSPKQKALIVKMAKNGIKIRGVSPITLAIGDGANDVAMIQEARVGVGISGHEGRQAVNSADFAIAQFRYLQHLMLVHGRWNYRRSATMVLYIFYVNIVFVLTSFIYNFFNQFSGSTIYFVFLTTVYSYPTQIPIAVAAIFNKDISKATALHYPAMYVSGRENLHLDRVRAIEYILKSFLHAFLICAFTMIWAVSDGIDIAQLGTGTYVACIYVCLGRCMLETFTWTWYNFWAVFFGFAFILAFEPIYYGLSFDIYILYGKTVLWDFDAGSAAYIWTTTWVAVIICYVLDVTSVYLRKEFFPSLLDVVIEIDHGYGQDDETATKKTSALTKVNKLFRKLAQPLTIRTDAIKELMAASSIKNVDNAQDRSAFAYDAPDDEYRGRRSTGDANTSSILEKPLPPLVPALSIHIADADIEDGLDHDDIEVAGPPSSRSAVSPHTQTDDEDSDEGFR